MSLSRHNKENICSSKNEIFNTGRRANEQFDIQKFFCFLYIIFLSSKDPYIKRRFSLRYLGSIL